MSNGDGENRALELRVAGARSRDVGKGTALLSRESIRQLGSTVLNIHTRGMPLGDGLDLAEQTERYAGADLENLARKAGLQALREDVEKTSVPMRIFEKVLGETNPSVTADMQRRYRRMSEELKQENVTARRVRFQPQSAAS